jgi:hypothetical protein
MSSRLPFFFLPSRFGESTADNHAHATTTVKVVYMCRVSIRNYVLVILNIFFSLFLSLPVGIDRFIGERGLPSHRIAVSDQASKAPAILMRVRA